MTCFRHPKEEAAAFCQGCGKPLCRECCRQVFGRQTHVCSEACAQTASQSPGSEEPRESAFARAYAAVFLTLLLAVLGGGLSLWMMKHAIFAEELGTKIDAEMGKPHFMGTRYYSVRIFRALGITNWKPQFGIGAAVGLGSALLYLAKNRRKASK